MSKIDEKEFGTKGRPRCASCPAPSGILFIVSTEPMPPARGQPTMSPCAKDSASHSGFLCHSTVLAEVFEGKKCHLATFIKTSLLLFLNREISVKRAKGQGHRLGSKKLRILGFMAFCGNGCSERELFSGV